MTATKTPEEMTKNRRSFLKTGLAAAGAATMGTGLLARGTTASAQQTAPAVASLQVMLPSYSSWLREKHSRLTFTPNITNWADIRDGEVPGGSGNRIYTESTEKNRSQFLSIHS